VVRSFSCRKVAISLSATYAGGLTDQNQVGVIYRDYSDHSLSLSDGSHAGSEVSIWPVASYRNCRVTFTHLVHMETVTRSLPPSVGLNTKCLEAILATGTNRRAKGLIANIAEILAVDPNLELETSEALVKKLQQAVKRAIYRVRPEPTWRWEAGELVKYNYKLYQERLSNEWLFYVELPKEISQEKLETMAIRAERRDYHLLGVKAGDHTTTAVLAKGKGFGPAIIHAMGGIIGMQLIKNNRLKDLQNAVQLLCRSGSMAVHHEMITWPTKVNDNPKYDGLVARVSRETMDQIKRCWYGMPQSTKWVQITIIDRENGHATKGAIMECDPGQEPEVYSESWKFGCLTGTLNPSTMLVHNTDSLYRPTPCLNIQALVYNYNTDEIKKLIEELFVPSIRKMTDFKHFGLAHGVEKLMALGYGIDLDRARYFHKKFVFEAATKAAMNGIRVKAAPNPDLEPFEIKVPKFCEWVVGDLVDVTRDPSLPVGNSTQRYTVVGYTNGNYCEISSEPWMTVQGGDYDGDDCSVTSDTVNILPGKVYDKTPVSLLTQKKKSVRTGATSWKERIKQAMYTIEGNIGKWDLMARRAYEMGRLDYEMKLQLSRAVQAEVDRKKHEVPIVNVPAIHNLEKMDFAINHVRANDWEAPIIKGTIYERIALVAQEVADTWLPLHGIDQQRIKIPDCKMAVSLRSRQLAEFYQDCFKTILRKNQENKTLSEQDVKSLTQAEMERLALRIKIRLDKAKKVGAWAVLARTLAKYSSPNLVCKVLTLDEARIVYSGSLVRLTN